MKTVEIVEALKSQGVFIGLFKIGYVYKLDGKFYLYNGRGLKLYKYE